MPAPKPPLPLASPLDSHDALLQREREGESSRRVRRWTAVAVALILTAGIVLGARPALHVAKAWQARRHARQAILLTEAGKMDEARVKVQDALTIWQQEPAAQRAAALFLTRAGAYRPAHGFWKQLDAARTLSPSDTREYALTELNLGEPEAAETLLLRVWPAGTEGTWPDWLLALQIARQKGRAGEVNQLAKRLLGSQSTPPRERLGAAGVLVASTVATPEDRALAWNNVMDLTRAGTTPESLAALALLAQARISIPPASLPTEAPTLSELIERIDTHPLAKIQQHLLVFDLRSSQEPARRAELIQAAVDQYGQAKENADLAVLAAWLYGKGEYDKILAVLPPARAQGDRALYLQYLDTLAALGRWTEIRASIQEKKFPLDPMLAQMFLARCAAQLGEPAVRDARWQAALEAAGKEPAKLLAVAQYAAKNGMDKVAATGYEAAVRAAPDSRAAHEEFIRFLETVGETRRLRAAVDDLHARWPQDLAARNDLAYLDALLSENVLAARNNARELVGTQPDNLDYRTTLALCELRSHNGLAALEAFDRHNIKGAIFSQPRQMAVYAAVLWEASFFAEAAEAIKNLPTTRLLPEERELIQPIKRVENR